MRPEFLRPPKMFSNFQGFPGAAALFLNTLTSTQSEPPPPYFPKPKTPIVPRGTHNLFIIECRPEFLRPPETFPNFQGFSGGGGSFPQYLTSLQSEPPPPYFPKLKTPIVPRGTHNLFIIECVPNFSVLPKCFRIFKVSRGRRLFSSIP